MQNPVPEEIRLRPDRAVLALVYGGQTRELPNTCASIPPAHKCAATLPARKFCRPANSAS